MVIWSEFNTGQYRDDDHQEDASHFTLAKWFFKSLRRSLFLAKLEESKCSNDDRVEDIETTEDSLTDNLKLLNKENISNVLGMHSKIGEILENFGFKLET